MKRTKSVSRKTQETDISLELCVDGAGAPVFRGEDDPDYQRIHRTLAEGVIFRDQPGVKELLTQREGRSQ